MGQLQLRLQRQLALRGDAGGGLGAQAIPVKTQAAQPVLLAAISAQVQLRLHVAERFVGQRAEQELGNFQLRDFNFDGLTPQPQAQVGRRFEWRGGRIGRCENVDARGLQFGDGQLDRRRFGGVPLQLQTFPSQRADVHATCRLVGSWLCKLVAHRLSLELAQQRALRAADLQMRHLRQQPCRARFAAHSPPCGGRRGKEQQSQHQRTQGACDQTVARAAAHGRRSGCGLVRGFSRHGASPLKRDAHAQVQAGRAHLFAVGHVQPQRPHGAAPAQAQAVAHGQIQV